MNPPKLTIPQLLEQRRYDPNSEPQPEQVILKIGGKKVGALQNLVTLTGKQKNGKSRYIGATIAAGLTGSELFQIQLILPPRRRKICLFDTEQSDFDFSRSMKQVKQFAGAEVLPPTFEAFNTREDDPAIQIQMIETYLQNTPECSVIIVDGVLDLLMSYNNEEESKRLANFIKRCTKIYNCLMIGVLHRGKGNDLTIGHIGSMADRIAQSVLKVEKDKDRNTFTLSSDFMRSDEDFYPVQIWNNAGHWEETFAPAETTDTKVKPLQKRPADYDIQDHRDNVRQIFNGTDYLSYEDLAQLIKEVYTVGRNWAVECISYLRSEGLVYRHPKGYSTQSQAKIFIQK